MPRLLKLHEQKTNGDSRYTFVGYEYHLMTHFPIWFQGFSCSTFLSLLSIIF